MWGVRVVINWRTIRPWGDTAENSPCHGPQAWEGLHATAGVSLLGSLGAVASSAATRTSPTRPGTATTTHASTTGSKLTYTLAGDSSPVTPLGARPRNPN